jgi:hypothetical protein
MEIAKAASFGTRKSQVQILPPRPPSNKMSGIKFYRHEFWVGSWVGGCAGTGQRRLVNLDEPELEIDAAALFPPGLHAGE